MISTRYLVLYFMKFPTLVPWYCILYGKKVVVRSTTRLGVLYVQFPVVDTPIKCEVPTSYKLIVCVCVCVRLLRSMTTLGYWIK